MIFKNIVFKNLNSLKSFLLRMLSFFLSLFLRRILNKVSSFFQMLLLNVMELLRHPEKHQERKSCEFGTSRRWVNDEKTVSFFFLSEIYKLQNTESVRQNKVQFRGGNGSGDIFDNDG